MTTARTRDGGHVHDTLRNDGQDMMVLAARGATLTRETVKVVRRWCATLGAVQTKRKPSAASHGLFVERVTRIELAL
ncbi:hypothetical protein GCM10010264_71080 [Streptomyces globisporus]|nr:hypothetical protein GCM10010264_71080 [Streptomyces globisporus]